MRESEAIFSDRIGRASGFGAQGFEQGSVVAYQQPHRLNLTRRFKDIGDTTVARLRTPLPARRKQHRPVHPVARLRAPLLDWMRRWRTARAGLDPQLVYREARRDPDDTSPLQQGLDDLAALFNLDD